VACERCSCERKSEITPRKQSQTTKGTERNIGRKPDPEKRIHCGKGLAMTEPIAMWWTYKGHEGLIRGRAKDGKRVRKKKRRAGREPGGVRGESVPGRDWFCFKAPTLLGIGKTEGRKSIQTLGT